MTVNKSFLLSILITTFFCSPIFSQERLTGLSGNPYKQSFKFDLPNTKESSNQEALHLPFFEDFSTSHIYPNQQNWADFNVFVNKDFPVFPPNSGAATFDVLNSNGDVYSHASINPFIADYLSSRTIRLDSILGESPRKLSPADSVYFSFYYQPQGRGDKPEVQDSLVLQFGYPTENLVVDYIDSITFPAAEILILTGQDQININDTIWSPMGCNPEIYILSDRIYTWDDEITMPCDTVFTQEFLWEKIWASEGMSLETFVGDGNETDYFKQVLIPIKDSIFFKEGFRFRFYNLATIAQPIAAGDQGNVDQWSVDMIYLNYGRSYQDIYLEKISFSDRAPSFLKRYESMPYRQYRSSPTTSIKEELSLKILNLSSETRNTKYQYFVEQTNGGQRFSWDGGNCNLQSFDNSGFQTCATGCGQKHACPPVESLFALDYDIDSTSFIIKHFISDSTSSNVLVDSLVYRQGFYNYFAYDDGTPELGYNLEPAFAYLAYQFTLNTTDTLKSVHILFNKTLGATNDMRFDLIVWNDINGRPKDILYRKNNLRPGFSDELFGFYTYMLDTPVVLNGTFYVGIMKVDQGNLNIGFDKVNNSKQYLFHNIEGVWQNSQFDGALMIRPAFGSGQFIAIDENPDLGSISFYPNPASNSLNLTINKSSISPESIEIMDITGRRVLQLPWSETINIVTLQSGVYFLRITEKHETIFQSKILIVR